MPAVRARSSLLALALAAIGGCCFAGCCSVDELAQVSSPRRDDVGYVTSAPADDRREVLACVAEVASDDGDPGTRRAAIAAARRWVDPAVEPDAALRATALRVLEVLRAQPDVDLVVARLGPRPDPSLHVRIAAVSALGALRGPVAEAALCAALARDDAREVRSAAARELGELRSYDPGVSSALAGALRDEALEVRLLAARALRATHDVDLGFDADTWRGWLARQPRFSAPTAPVEPEDLGPYPEDAPLEADEYLPAEPPAGDEPPADAAAPPDVIPPEPHDPTEEPGEQPTGPASDGGR